MSNKRGGTLWRIANHAGEGVVHGVEQPGEVRRDNGDELGVVLDGGAKITNRTSARSWCHGSTDGER